MKKRILGILTVALALSMVFTMVSCGDGGGGGGGAKNVTITFTSVMDNDTTQTTKVVIPEKTAIPDSKFPNTPVRAAGNVFQKWQITDGPNAGQTLSKGDGTTFAVDTKVDAVWLSYDPDTEAAVTFYAYGLEGLDEPPADVAAFLATLDPYDVIIVDKGTTIAASDDEFPNDPLNKVAGYKFKQWGYYVEEDLLDPDVDFEVLGEPQPFAATTQVDENVIVLAQWEVSNVVYVTISFNVNYPQGFTYTGPAINPKQIEINVPIEDYEADLPEAQKPWLPVVAAPDGYVFDAWYQGATKVTGETAFGANATLSAVWILDQLTYDDSAYELLYLSNGAYAVYQFDIPEGKTLEDYVSVSFGVKVSAGALAIWDGRTGGQVRGIRLYGVFDSTMTPDIAANSTTYGLDEVRFLNANTYNADGAAYIIQNPGNATIRNNLTADEWYTVTHSLASTITTNPNPPSKQSGRVYFALGISCQNTSGGTDRSQSFIQLVRDIKLNPVEGGTVVTGVKPTVSDSAFLKPGFIPPQFMAYQDPMVFDWRATPSQENIDNWRDLVPAMPVDTFNRGSAPADLVQVVLSSEDDPNFTYVNRGNPNNQKGWATFTEAGRANDQSATITSTIAFENFKEAWYLVLETAEIPKGGTSLIWMGGAGGWNGNAVFANDGTPNEEAVEITGNEGAYVIKFFLPKALGQYGRFYNGNTEWAAFCIQYWGPDSANINTLDISKAYLLVETKVADPTGIAAKLGFSLTEPPAGGDLIKDVVLNQAGDELEITTASGLSDFRWYVDGDKNDEEGATLTLEVEPGNYTIAVQAKKGGKWVSQTVFITVKE